MRVNVDFKPMTTVINVPLTKNSFVERQMETTDAIDKANYGVIFEKKADNVYIKTKDRYNRVGTYATTQDIVDYINHLQIRYFEEDIKEINILVVG